MSTSTRAQELKGGSLSLSIPPSLSLSHWMLVVVVHRVSSKPHDYLTYQEVDAGRPRRLCSTRETCQITCDPGGICALIANRVSVCIAAPHIPGLVGASHSKDVYFRRIFKSGGMVALLDKPTRYLTLPPVGLMGLCLVGPLLLLSLHALAWAGDAGNC